MLSKRCQRHHSFLNPSKFTDRLKPSNSGTLSSDTITTTSSGYSTGGSTVSTNIISSLKKPSCNQHKNKSNILPKSKHINSTTSNDISSTDMILQCSKSCNLSSDNAITLPFIYYNKLSKQSEYNNKENHESYLNGTTNFEKISAWLDHTEIITQDHSDLLFIDDILQESIPSSPAEIDRKIIMKKTSSTNKTPKRSSSMVATMTRPIIERKQYEKSISPTFSFSSSILARGMTESLTPQTSYHQSRTNLTDEQTNKILPKSNRRRTIDFSRRRTVDSQIDQMNNNNKENLPNSYNQQIYQFSPPTSNNLVTKKYYFHSNPPPVKNEDILMNSYGLTILQQQRQQPITTNVKNPPQISRNSSLHKPQKQLSRQPSIIQQKYISESLDDILCDREVESYFYPKQQHQSPISIPQHVYMNLGTSSSHYYQPPSYIHSTLC
ncbi:unnamed protein product [Adineta steineri]|uniref:Uncharacterized protein n=1 Tax=Adineta steineri TaxID=433720 RepID=A0A815BJF8_9BILA|nr:unnamed protein product [Adineta steineri]